jgi:hypothetical protein
VLETVLQRHPDAVDERTADEERQGIGAKPTGKNEREASAKNDGAESGGEFRPLSGC